MDEFPHPGATRYVVSWLVLAVLTAVTFALSHVHLGDWSVAIALAIATVKGGVVTLFFMHLWDHPGANRLVFVVSLLFVAVLMAIVLLDVMTRFPPALPH